MRSIPVSATAQIKRRCSSDWIKVEIEDHNGDMQPHAPYVVEYEEPSADQPVGFATVTFRRGEDASSLAPLMTANPPIDVGRLIRISIDPGHGSFVPVFEGRIDRWSSPGRNGDVVVEARDLAGRIVDTFIGTERAYGSETGTPLEDVIQQVGDDNLEDPPTLYVPVATSAVVVTPPDYVPSDVGVYEAHRGLADSVAFTVCYQYVDGDGWRYTLFQPARGKTTPDHVFGGGDYYEVTALDLDITDIRNVVQVEYSDHDGVRQRVQYPSAANVASDPSVQKYGVRYMRINEASDSVIRDATSALALAQAAYSDLSEPDATLEIQCAYFWPGQIGVDLYRFNANGRHFSSNQDLAPVSIRHRLALDERPQSWVRVRGKPTGGVLLWKRKSRQQRPTEPDAVLQIRNLTIEDNGDGTLTVDWDVGAKITQSWASYSIVTAPETPAKWAAVRDAVLPVTPPITITRPTEESGTAQLGLLWVEGRYVDPATGDYVVGDIERRTVYPKVHIPAIDPDTGDLAEAAIKARKQFAANLPVFLPVLTEGDKPADNATADYVLVLENGKAYEWSGSAWVDYTGTPAIATYPALSAAIIKAFHISVDSLAEINESAGIIVSGVFRNASGTAAIRLDDDDEFPAEVEDFIDLSAEGVDPIFKIGGVQVLADGTTVVEDVVEKVAVLTHWDFRPSVDFGYISSVGNTSLTGGTTALSFGARAPVPPGSDLVSISLRGELTDLANVCELDLIKIDSGGTITTLATSTLTSTTDQTIISFVSSETVDPTARYILRVSLEDNSGTGDPPLFRSVTVNYQSHSYRETL